MLKQLPKLLLALLALHTAPAFAQTLTLGYVAPTPRDGSAFTIAEGQTFDADVALLDTDPTQTVALASVSIPGTAIQNPRLPIVVVGDGVNPVTVSSHVSFTAPPGSAGRQFLFLYDASDSPGGARITTGFAVNVSPPPIKAGAFTTYTQGGWGAKPAGNNPGKILANNFSSVYPLGCRIGIFGLTGFWLNFTSASAIEKFLPTGGTPNPLTSSKVNPTAPTSAGVFAGQVLALELNCDFSLAGITQGPGGPVGLVKLTNTGNSLLDGKTIYQVLFAANIALGGGPLSFGIASISEFNTLVTNLNEAFDNGGLSGWAQTHLVK
jgi:hypothetical protein